MENTVTRHTFTKIWPE